MCIFHKTKVNNLRMRRSLEGIVQELYGCNNFITLSSTNLVENEAHILKNKLQQIFDLMKCPQRIFAYSAL